MIGKKTLFSRNSDEWQTPPSLLLELEQRGYRFTLDLAATPDNKICPHFVIDLLTADIPETLEETRKFFPYLKPLAWCNPPYSQVGQFVKKIYESRIPCILLLPARTDTRWFHDFIYQKENVRIQFLKGRLKFSGAKYNAPFPSMLVYMNLDPICECGDLFIEPCFRCKAEDLSL